MARFLWLATLAATALANFQVSTDATTYAASSGKLKVEWLDDGYSPSNGDFSTATFLMCTVIGSDFTCDVTLGKGVTISQTDTSEEFTLSDVSSEGGSGYYVVQMNALASDGSYTINYSPWFQVTGMTGSKTAGKGSVPAPEYKSLGSGTSWTASASLPASLQSLASSWMIPYTYQADATRYAPFQPTPATKVTASLSASRRNPTSAYTVYTTYKQTQLPFTTLTPSPATHQTLYQNYASTLAVTPSGSSASKVTATLARRRRRRWAD